MYTCAVHKVLYYGYSMIMNSGFDFRPVLRGLTMTSTRDFVSESETRETFYIVGYYNF